MQMDYVGGAYACDDDPDEPGSGVTGRLHRDYRSVEGESGILVALHTCCVTGRLYCVLVELSLLSLSRAVICLCPYARNIHGFLSPHLSRYLWHIWNRSRVRNTSHAVHSENARISARSESRSCGQGSRLDLRAHARAFSRHHRISARNVHTATLQGFGLNILSVSNERFLWEDALTCHHSTCSYCSHRREMRNPEASACRQAHQSRTLRRL